MVEDRSDEGRAERLLDLDVDGAPEPIGVYERPDQASTVGRSVAVMFALFLLLVLAYFVLTAIL
ncbi:MAG: hypothetical protein RRC07_10030 [Anaerolineae bacterium]|nr:hypothetical protein [Anaerolineae bacterium]